MEESVADRYKCRRCDYLTTSCSRILKHYQYMHSQEAGFQINCLVQNCPKTYTIVDSLVRHLKNKHPVFANEYLIQNGPECRDFSQCQEDMDIDDPVPNQPPVEPPLEPIQYDYDNQIGMFLLNLKERQNVQQVALSSLSAEMKSVIELNNAQLIRQFEIALENSRQTGQEIDFDSLLRQQNVAAAGAFGRLSSSSRLKSFSKTRLNTNEPMEIVMGYDDNGKPHTMQYVSILETLKALLSHEDVVAQVLKGHKSEDGVLRDFCDGSLFAQNQLFSQDETALQVLLYIDEFTVANPLGYRVTKYKITAVYFLLGNLEPKFRSKVSLIQLAALARSMHVKKYGMLTLLDPVVHDLKVLETDGIQVNFENRTLRFRGTCSMCAADNLGAHDIGMFPLNFSTSLRLCRMCMVTKFQLSDSYRETFPMRTIDGYNEQAAAVIDHPDLASVYGVKGKSPLCDLEYYHVINGLPSCIAHDLFEGAVPEVLEEVVTSLIADGYITMSELQKCVNEFPYADADKSNKPCIINIKKLKLKFTQAQTWCFVRLFPLIIGPKVPEGNVCWSLIHDLLNIIDHVCSPAHNEMSITYLESLVVDFFTAVDEIYPDLAFKPKYHYMTHYGSQIRKFGPISHCSTQRFESKHDESKQKIYRTKNRKNICKTLAVHIQAKQALIHSSALLLGEGQYTVTGASSIHIRLYEQEVQNLVQPYLQGTEIVPECAKVKIDSVQYSVGSVVILGLENYEYSFGLIRYVFILKDKPFLCTELLEIDEYSTHYHAYKVTKTGDLRLCQVSELFDYHPLGLYHVQGSQYVTLRYTIAQ